MLRLMLLRHAKSDWPAGVDDHERPLAERGRRAAPAMGAYMAREGLSPDLAVISTARRVRETWELARPALAGPVARRDEPRLYEASSGTLLEVVRETDEKVHVLLLVGHNPGLQDLALDLIGTASRPDLARLRDKFPTGGLAVIDFPAGSWSKTAAASGRLERFETPRSVAGRT